MSAKERGDEGTAGGQEGIHPRCGWRVSLEGREGDAEVRAGMWRPRGRLQHVRVSADGLGWAVAEGPMFQQQQRALARRAG